jgi:MFS family permease
MTPNAPISSASETPARAGLHAAIAAISIAGFGFALMQPLVAVLLEERGTSGFFIGLMSSTLGISMLAGGVIVPPLLRFVALADLLIGAAVLAAALTPLMLVFDSYWSWLALRLAMGLAGTALFWGSELWIVTAAPPERRGTWLGIYGLFLALGLFAGPALLTLVGTDGRAPFLWGAAIVLAATLPVFAARGHSPKGLGGARRSPLTALRFFRTDPTLTFAVLFFACFEFGLLGLLPVWGLRVGYEESLAILLASVVALSGVVFDIPMGYLSDRVGRRALLGTAAAALLAMAGLAPFLAASYAAVVAMLFLAGGVSIALYVVPLAEFATRYTGPRLAEANGAVIVAYGFGTLVSPVLFGQAMDLVAPHGLLWCFAALAGLYLGLVLWRARARA